MDSFSILLIEDSRHDVEMILDTFRDRNITEKLRIFYNGSDALDYFFGMQGCLQRSGICHIHFALLDLKLPKIDGLEVLTRLKSDERTREIPVIIFSSSNEAKDRKECYLRGANSYIVKPLDADLFSTVVYDIISYWLKKNRTAYQDR
jgi:two-component system response regulator